MTSPRYMLMTAAYNEARFLPAAIESVLAQTLRPDRWIIVSDASTDDTDRIAAEAAAAHDFIKFLRFENPAPRSPYPMGGVAWKKVSALNAGLAAFGPVTADYLGNIDADVTFEPDFFARLVEKLDAEPDIGLGGGFIYNTNDGVLGPYFINPDVVGGPAQVFRRRVYEAIGGYIAWGQEDTIAQIMVRMHGHRVHSFADLTVLHHKVARKKGGTPLKGQFHSGRMERAMRFHPLHMAARCASRLGRRPLGSLARLAGYGWAAVQGLGTRLPAEVIAFNRREQMAALRRRLTGRSAA